MSRVCHISSRVFTAVSSALVLSFSAVVLPANPRINVSNDWNILKPFYLNRPYQAVPNKLEKPLSAISPQVLHQSENDRRFLASSSDQKTDHQTNSSSQSESSTQTTNGSTSSSSQTDASNGSAAAPSDSGFKSLVRNMFGVELDKKPRKEHKKKRKQPHNEDPLDYGNGDFESIGAY